MAIIQRTFDYVPAAESMHGGKAGTSGYGMRWEVSYDGPVPNAGDTWKILIADATSGLTITIGAGDTTGIVPTFCKTYNNKVYLLAASQAFFSAIGDPEIWNDPNGLGNGFVNMDNQTERPEDVAAIATFQGKLAFLSRRAVQLWQVAADPGEWQILQVLENTGTIAKDSVRATGQVDVLYLSDVGISSLRAREVTGNAFVDDLGSAIASVVLEKIAADTNDGANACAVIEPATGQYWLFLHDTIFVFSYYPSSKVLAWSTFLPTSTQGDTFVPEKFVVQGGKVYCRAGNMVFLYGGATGAVYDNTQVTVELPFLDLKTPGKYKTSKTVKAVFSGYWKIHMTWDLENEIYPQVPVWDGGEDHPFLHPTVPAPGGGTHVKFRLTSQHQGPAKFSSLVLNYSIGNDV